MGRRGQCFRLATSAASLLAPRERYRDGMSWSATLNLS